MSALMGVWAEREPLCPQTCVSSVHGPAMLYPRELPRRACPRDAHACAKRGLGVRGWGGMRGNVTPRCAGTGAGEPAGGQQSHRDGSWCLPPSPCPLCSRTEGCVGIPPA